MSLSVEVFAIQQFSVYLIEDIILTNNWLLLCALPKQGWTCCCLVPKLYSTLWIPWTIAHQAPPLSMGLSRQEYWSGLPFPSPGDLPDPGIEPASLMPPALAGGFFITSATWEAQN